LGQLLETIYQGVSVDRIWRRAERIWQSDRWMTAPAWRRTARYVAAELAKSGAEGVEIYPCPADGESVIHGQRMWPEWNVRDAILEIVHPRREVLGHYRTQPRSLMTHSAPTPRGGLEADLVRVDDGRHEKDYRGLEVTGRIVFTRQHGAEMAGVAAKLGAVGVLSDFLVSRDSTYLSPWLPKLSPPELLPDPPDWEQHLQWMHLFRAQEHGLFGFALSPAAGERLRRRLARGRVRVHAVVDSRFSRGTCPSVTGVVPGTGREQVLVLSHLFEQGANDNASGCAVSLEVASCLNSLIAAGRLAQPRRSIRLFQGLEWQGMLAYLHEHQEQLPRTRAAICLDCLGQDEAAAQVPLPIYRNPPDKPAFTDPLIEWVARQWLASHDEAFHWMSRPYAGGTDNIIAEDPFGIPCPFIGGAVRHWHTTADTMETLSRRTLTHAAVIAATYCYFVAAAGPKEAKLLLGLCETYGRRAMVEHAAHDAEQGVGTEASSAEVRQELARSVARLETIVPLVAAGEQTALRETVSAARARLKQFARALL
jgi:hypothetical protein